MTLSEFISTHALDSKQRIISNLVRDEKSWFKAKGFDLYYNLLMEKTSFLLPDTSITLRIFCIQNDIIEYPKCNVCGKNIINFKEKRKIRKVCSSDCSAKSIDRIQKTIKTKIEKYGCQYNNMSKTKKTKMDRYGDENFNNQSKNKETLLKTYGVNSIFNIKENRIKANQTKKTKQLESLLMKFSDRYTCIDSENFIFKCKQCGEEIKLDTTRYWTNVIRCYSCFPHNISLSEAELQSWLSTLTDFDSNKKILSKNFEIDIIVNEKQLAIEFDGIYWHSEDIRPDKYYHLNKTNECKTLGLNLLHIFENEWVCPIKKEIWKSLIKSKLGMNKTIWARKCVIKKVNKKDSTDFLTHNHLQGNCQSSINLGLYYGDDIVCLLTLSKSRFNKKYVWEITRYCNKLGYNVVGGFSKLLSNFRKEFSGSIITYADKRYSTGDMYSKVGFIELKDSTPNYWYWKTPERLFSRIEFQKHKLLDKLDTFDPILTEAENMRRNGYKRIWDCGNKVFVLY